MTKEWFNYMPPSGILCKCKKERRGQYIVDVITRYTDRPASEYKFKSNSNWYYDAIPLTPEEASVFLYHGDADE